MAKIVKNDDAPEGGIELTYTGGSIKIDGRGHKTDDWRALEAARLYPEYFTVEDDDPEEIDRSTKRTVTDQSPAETKDKN